MFRNVFSNNEIKQRSRDVGEQLVIFTRYGVRPGVCPRMEPGRRCSICRTEIKIKAVPPNFRKVNSQITDGMLTIRREFSTNVVH